MGQPSPAVAGTSGVGGRSFLNFAMKALDRIARYVRYPTRTTNAAVWVYCSDSQI